MISKALLLLTVLLAGVSASAQINGQPTNLLQNPDADLGPKSWREYGDATVEANDSSSYFVVRKNGNFSQDVALPKDAAGQYLLFIGLGASERVNSNGSITGLPYLYGYMMKTPGPGEKEILAYLDGQGMLAQIRFAGEWVKMWGIFEVPPGTTKVRFFLMQGLAADGPHNGSAAQFDSLGLFLFRSAKDARAFVQQY